MDPMFFGNENHTLFDDIFDESKRSEIENNDQRLMNNVMQLPDRSPLVFNYEISPFKTPVNTTPMNFNKFSTPNEFKTPVMEDEHLNGGALCDITKAVTNRQPETSSFSTKGFDDVHPTCCHFSASTATTKSVSTFTPSDCPMGTCPAGMTAKFPNSTHYYPNGNKADLTLSGAKMDSSSNLRTSPYVTPQKSNSMEFVTAFDKASGEKSGNPMSKRVMVKNCLLSNDTIYKAAFNDKKLIVDQGNGKVDLENVIVDHGIQSPSADDDDDDENDDYSSSNCEGEQDEEDEYVEPRWIRADSQRSECTKSHPMKSMSLKRAKSHQLPISKRHGISKSELNRNGNVIKRRKRKSSDQLQMLKDEFDRNPVWTKEVMAAVAKKTGLSEAQVYKWGWDQKKKFGEKMF